MNNITLFSAIDTGSTVIKNTFIDEYMPRANGSYVKVYLLLLRCLQSNFESLSLSYLAEKLDETEKDIDRALRYWEKEDLLIIQRADKSLIVSITFQFMKEVNQNPSKATQEVSSELNLDIKTAFVDTKPMSMIHKPNYSDAQIKQLTDMEEVKWIINTVERLLERLLKPTDIQLILFLYESIGFSADLIFYLYEYCVSKNKKNSSYIETVAIAWAEEGIDTVAKAEETTSTFNNNYNAVNKAFGLNRAPGSIEKKFMHRWFHEYGFDIGIIEEACNRAILATTKPDFKYTDKILENWKKQGVLNLKDIEHLDEVYAKQNAQSASNKLTIPTKQPVSKNKFNAFPQRKYSDEEFLSMEQRLLNNR